MKTLIILPTYNEKENIVDLITAILNLDVNYSVCVVDDNSPDGTHKIVQNYIETSPQKKRINLIVRNTKDGRGGAVRTGIKWGLAQNEFDYFVEMDCDFSHAPNDLPRGIEILKNSDVALGSRYPDGQIIGWPPLRKIMSFVANLIARTIISRKIFDYTNGFRFYNLKAAKLICELPQHHKGYVYLSETLSYFLKHKYKITSFTVIFVNRERGISNTNFKEVSNAFLSLFQIAWRYHFGSNK